MVNLSKVQVWHNLSEKNPNLFNHQEKWDLNKCVSIKIDVEEILFVQCWAAVSGFHQLNCPEEHEKRFQIIWYMCLLADKTIALIFSNFNNFVSILSLELFHGPETCWLNIIILSVDFLETYLLPKRSADLLIPESKLGSAILNKQVSLSHLPSSCIYHDISWKVFFRSFSFPMVLLV